MNDAAKAAIGGAGALLLAECWIFASLGSWMLNLSPIWFAAAVMLVLAVAAVIAKRGPKKERDDSRV